ncbi:metal ABC transporter solute-binding protein, Zn/Mn family [Pseudomonas cedrina]|uniref:metal ABC transporter solute-binding protein, Zn/Mn family n=1 Tax=Pseudomonas cedrina TaxID=651740 RepID=UPI002785CA01|nr:zinc ABC transporter substrate-binding protein [Pseudomonas cedrina]MDQ0654915.1 hypothetical protein [Pseudomonas cedrina]
MANIVGDRAQVIALIPAEANSHNYQPQPDDITRAMNIDVLVVNGIGHDEWVSQIIKAAGRTENLPIIQAGDHIFVLEPEPYLENEEGVYIQQFTKLVVTIGLPRAGWWGIAALNIGSTKTYKGKPLSQDAVLWIQARDMK